jgi:hypothetical protein
MGFTIPRLEGCIFGDTKGQFKDGERIKTFTVLAVTNYGTIAHTLRNKYRLVPPMILTQPKPVKQSVVEDH